MTAYDWMVTEAVFIKSLWWIIPIVVAIFTTAIAEHFE